MNGQGSVREQGVAVITAILIMAMAASVASFLAWQQGIWTRQVQNMRDQAQAETLAAAGVEWARGILAEDAKEGDTDHPGEAWAQTLAGLEVENGQLGGYIRDAQARYNLNNLKGSGPIQERNLAIFKRLLQNLKLNPEIGDRISAWLNPVTASGGTAAAPVAPTQSGATSGRLLYSANNLYAVEGIARDDLDRLYPYVIALPATSPTQINVNTAPPELLSAVLELPLTQAQALVRARERAPFKGIEDFRARLPASVAGVDESLFNVASQYFLVNSQAMVGRVTMRYRALLNRQGAAWPKVIWRVPGGA
ncbi:type II secretion system minor pseudopilin GspK [Thermithiobacillus plumbiphilus]|uniref:Type II secretion system protein K n=1 Tax=Thermithiobacillus plumbiphilus TaxID=1729899 RepID=A0ABU9D9H1_9PROT